MKDRLDRLPAVGTALAVQERYTRDGADPFAAGIAFFAFLSLFPLILLAISVAGFVFSDPDDQIAIGEALTEAIPGFEAAMDDGEDATGVADLVEGVVNQRGTIGLVGGVLLLLSGLRVVNGAMIATRVVFRGEVQSGVLAKVRQIAALVGLGALALLGVAGSSLAGVGVGQLPAGLSIVVSLAITFALDFLLFLGAYVLLSQTASLSVRQRIPGAILGAAGWTVLKVAGATYVANQVENANALYGALGGVIALMLLLYLAGRLYLYGAELTAVVHERQHGPLQAPTAAVPVEVVTADGSADGGPSSTARATRSGPAGASDPSGPPPPPRVATAQRPRDPGRTARAPSIGEDTRHKLEEIDARRRAVEEHRDRGSDARHAMAIGLGVAALAAAWRWMKPDPE